ncbi:MAG: polyphosphate kinase 1 [Acidobacteria bacterium]|nr:polyphosphate kinase 1 [Acidobacteriota bacterium]
MARARPDVSRLPHFVTEKCWRPGAGCDRIKVSGPAPWRATLLSEPKPSQRSLEAAAPAQASSSQESSSSPAGPAASGIAGLATLADVTPIHPSTADSAALFINRELSWLDFNLRVLHEARDESNPPIERLKFIAIFDNNLDEFFMKRVGGLKHQLASNVRELPPDSRTPRQQLAEINAVVRPMLAEQRRLLNDELLPALRQHGLEILRWDEIKPAERRHLAEEFDRKIFPVLTPLAVDPAHPFPFISNLSLSLAVSVRSPGGGGHLSGRAGTLRFARIKAPHILPRWVQVPKTLRFVPIEEVIANNLQRLFEGMEIVESHPFRVTRNSDVQRNEDAADDLLEAIQEELRERRFATVVRLELAKGCPEWMRQLLCEQLDIGPQEVFELDGPLGLRDLMQLASVALPSLRFRPWTPVTHPRLAALAGLAPLASEGGDPDDIFGVIAGGDLLVHHPYDSFTTSVQRFIEVAASDPAVFAIKQTLYRTSSDSPNMRALIRAAEARKQVAATVEIKARFDEAANIEWAEALEGVGAHVAYGVVGLKTHAKIALAVRRERDQLRSYVHLGTGNYNPETAKLYTDLGLFTANEELAADVAQLFNMLTGYVHRPHFKKLLVAPINMRQRFLELIRREVEHSREGRGGHIIAKMNSLEDREIVEALYAASAAGVEMDLVVRGICRLRPGVPGQSETIRVISIIGRFLEHARIFYFANAGQPEYFIGSADWMSRNLDYRVEAIAPVEEPRLQEELKAILDLQLADNVKAWDLRADGTYVKRRPAPGEPTRSSQEILMQRAQDGLRTLPAGGPAAGPAAAPAESGA